MEVKFKIINDIKEEDLIEVRMRIFKNDISHSRFIWLIYIMVVIYLILHKFDYFKRVYSYSVYPASYKDILLGLFMIFTGIYIWRLPYIMAKYAFVIGDSNIDINDFLEYTSNAGLFECCGVKFKALEFLLEQQLKIR